MSKTSFKAWGHDVHFIKEEDVQVLKEKEFVVCQIAEGGAMGYAGGVFLVSSSGEVYYTTTYEPGDYLREVFPQISEFRPGLMGFGDEFPLSYCHKYLGMGNHLLVNNKISKQFFELAHKYEEAHPETILYNLWMDVILELLSQ